MGVSPYAPTSDEKCSWFSWGRTYVSARKRAITQDCPYAEHRRSYFREAAFPLQSTSSPLWGGSSPSFQCFGVTSKGRPLMEYSLALWIWTWSFPRNFTSRRTCSDSRCSSFATEGSLRSEEHTSELQSRLHLVCRLLLEKKKKEKVTMY